MSAPAANLSIRSARREFRTRFEAAIASFRGVCELDRLNRNVELGSLLSRLPPEMARRVVRFYVGNTDAARELYALAQPFHPPPAAQFEIFIRKRPLWTSESADGEYDCLTVDEAVNRCVVHDGKAARDMSTYTLHKEFALDGVYGADTAEGSMLARVVDPLFELARSGGRASLITFGQTGTGKTFTTNTMQRYLAARLFETEAEAGAHWAYPPSHADGAAEAGDFVEVSVEIFELREKKAYDLLNERKQVRLVTDAEEHVHVLGGTKLVARSTAELLEAITTAHSLRSVAATERNAQSSRSHCVSRLRLVRRAASSGAGAAAVGPADGLLTLVDLAGSERNDDTTQHDARATRESADINMSLQTLKECFRATINKDVDLETFVEIDQDDVEWTRAVPKGYKAALAKARAAAEQAQKAGLFSGEATYNGLAFDPAKPAALMNFVSGQEAIHAKALHMPYRRHQLTLLLKDCFVNAAHRTAVLACCSPTATDVEHTVRTLNQVCQMRGAEDEISRVVRIECGSVCMVLEGEAAAAVPFRKWKADKLREWLLTLEDDLACAAILLPDSCDGRELLQRWPASRLQHTCLEGDAERATRLYKAIRAEAARVDALLAEQRGRVRGFAGRADDKIAISAAAKKKAAAAPTGAATSSARMERPLLENVGFAGGL